MSWTGCAFRTCSCWEGGYSLEALGECVAALLTELADRLRRALIQNRLA